MKTDVSSSDHFSAFEPCLLIPLNSQPSPGPKIAQTRPTSTLKRQMDRMPFIWHKQRCLSSYCQEWQRPLYAPFCADLQRLRMARELISLAILHLHATFTPYPEQFVQNLLFSRNINVQTIYSSHMHLEKAQIIHIYNKGDFFEISNGSSSIEGPFEDRIRILIVPYLTASVPNCNLSNMVTIDKLGLQGYYAINQQ
ncbi:hypothetical protein RND71_005698 [Anisodus tanguticus]|uniref:Uncharacterized protein n=1 Tax=Anisodus tanguticus TaxID=243964 RepID=A0AAE1SUQ9_9SOLA|nr:hypothetical protein RND71_005698 [Anisodus tanguticus]